MGDSNDLIEDYSIVVLGSLDTGKSSLIFTFIQTVFPKQGDKMPDLSRRHSRIDNDTCLLQIYDPKEGKIKETVLKSAHGFMFCYNIADRSSLDATLEIRKKVIAITGKENFPSILVGTMLDEVTPIRNNANNKSHQSKTITTTTPDVVDEVKVKKKRAVSIDEARRIGEALGMPAIEVSAKDGKNVDECFHNLVRLIRRSKGFKGSTNSTHNNPNCTIS